MEIGSLADGPVTSHIAAARFDFHCECPMPLAKFVNILDELHATYHRREFVPPDPLQFLYAYPDPLDREVVALVASSLAYGRVGQILKSVAAVLERMGPPRKFVWDHSPAAMGHAMGGFVHRFNTGDDVAELLGAVRRLAKRHGSLHRLTAGLVQPGEATVGPAMARLAKAMQEAGVRRGNFLLSDPSRGGACKRLNLMMRWLVRREDGVDVGDWGDIPPAKLLVPLDVHMHRICRALGATRRNQADGRAVLEVTAAFSRICPADPARYDFALTRLGIRNEMPAEGFLRYFESQRAKGPR